MMSLPEQHGRVRRTVWVVALAVLATYASCVLPVFYEQLKEYFAIGSGAYGFMFSVGSLGGVLTALIGGVLVDRRGPRRVIRLCLFGLGLSMVLFALCGRLWAIMAAALGVGALFQTTFYIAITAHLVRAFPEHKRRVLALNFAAMSAGCILFPVLAENLLWLVHSVPSFRFAWALHGPFALIALVLLASALLYRPPRAAVAEAGTARPWRWADIRLPGCTMALVVMASLHAIVDTTLYIWMPAYLARATFASRPIRPGWVLAAYGAAYLVSRGALMLFRESTGRRAFLILPGLLGGATLVAGILSRDYTTTAICYVLGGLLWSVEFPAVLSLIAEEEGPRFGTANAMVNLCAAAGAFLMLNQTGWLVDRLGESAMWKAMMIPAMGFPCFSLGAAWWLFARRNRRKPS